MSLETWRVLVHSLDNLWVNSLSVEPSALLGNISWWGLFQINLMKKKLVMKKRWIIYCEQKEIENIFWFYLIAL